MKSARLIAERYAQALSRAVTDDAEFVRVRDELTLLARLLGASAELRRVLAHPAITFEAKLNVLKELARRLGARRGTTQLSETLAAHERLTLLPAVAEAVGRLADRRMGITEVEIRTAAPLDVGLQRQLRAVLERITQGKIKTKEITAPELLGGLVVRVGGTVFDGSVRTRLEQLRQVLGGRQGAASPGR